MSLDKWSFNSARTAVVSTEHYWVPVTDDTPVGAKMLVIDDKQRIAYLRDYQPNQGWTHVFPLPRFKDMK